MISMGNVWDRTAEFLSEHLASVLPIALVAIFVPAVISGNFSELQQSATPSLAATLGLGSFVLALVSFWGQLAVTALVLDPSHARAAAGLATRRFPAALLVMAVILLTLLALAVPVPLILGATGVNFAAMSAGTMPQVPPAAAMGVTIYFLLLLPLLLWLGARLVVMLPVIVGERLALGAFARSWHLTRGAALRIVGVLILYVVVSIVANLAATTAFGAVMYLVAGRGADGLSLATVLTSIVGGAVSTAFVVLGTVFVAKLFVALLLRERGREEAARTQ